MSNEVTRFYSALLILFSFFLIKKKQKIKPVRKGNSFSLEFPSHEPAPGTRDLARSFMQKFSFVLRLVAFLRSFFDLLPFIKLETCSDRKIGAMEILLARSS